MNYKTKYLLIGIFVVMIFAFGIIALQSRGSSYTVLYFTNVQDPFILNNNTLTINFTVENHENRVVDYTYVVPVYSQGETDQKLNEVRGKMTSKDGEIVAISENIAVEEFSISPIRVYVQLYMEGVNETYRSIWYERQY